MDVCHILNTNNALPTIYTRQTNRSAEIFKTTILPSLVSYIKGHPRDWDLYSPALTYVCNSQAHISTSIAPFGLFLSRSPGSISSNFRQPSLSIPTEFKKTWNSGSWKQLPTHKTSSKMFKHTTSATSTNAFVRTTSKSTPSIKSTSSEPELWHQKETKASSNRLRALPRHESWQTTQKCRLEHPENVIENVTLKDVVLQPKTNAKCDIMTQYQRRRWKRSFPTTLSERKPTYYISTIVGNRQKTLPNTNTYCWLTNQPLRGQNTFSSRSIATVKN